ncbi:MAG: LacI family transcriptional regulator [Actinomycetota bacterium]|nr:LacI family transcriptional regulator [Actinomycetota bacterium]
MVAARAGVGRGTASRALSGAPQVSQRAREAVQRAAEELGYRPNRAARSLVTRRTDSIALVVGETEDRVFADSYFGALTRGVNAELGDSDVQLVFLIARSATERKRLENFAIDRRVDGMLLVSMHGDDPLPDALDRAGMPLVLGGRPLRDDGRLVVDADNRGGARAAVEHLIGTGRRRIATITGPMDMAAGVDRLEGYYDALRAAKRRPAKALVAPSDFTEETGHAAMVTLLRREPTLDAVFAASDVVAAGALRALREARRDVPGEVAVVGFDDRPLARHLQPALTTVRQPVEAIGRQMTRMLLAQMHGEPIEQRCVVLATELVVRESA